MDYKEEDREDKKYRKGYSRQEFKKDVAEAVEPVVNKKKGKKAAAMKALKSAMKSKSAMKPKPYPTKRSAYAKMSVTELRKLLNTKKKKLLTKAGFPDGGIPRSKDAMVSLCMRLKRKRW